MIMFSECEQVETLNIVFWLDLGSSKWKFG